MTELAGQETLPADFPAPVITADILINKSITEGLAQLEYFRIHLSIFDEAGNRRQEEDDAQKNLRIAKGNMHLFSYLLDSVIADVLQQIQGVNRTWADKAAAELEDKLEGGDYYPEMLWEWARARGLDPETITEKAKARIQDKDTQ
ncbi:hypothetical protein [Arthrobacter sp. PsM3]|uniref:hypothetical protein n=1 Tax=Arthrobacter sp. PsM3 TaxID=3030531 RepID=UPI00263A7317|nr:hypothetical protein [Arthrobacter sp. PsM3]MDN4644951.1 hypothetical protein [Arthrobacter sp. PsM3]